MSSVIFATRRGYLYQDRVAVELYLKEMKNKNIKEFYIDFPYLNNSSLDVKFIDINGNQVVCEVKSGGKFNIDKAKIKKAILTLKEIRNNSNNIKLSLIVRKNLQGQILQLRAAIDVVQKYSLNHPEVENKLFWLVETFSFSETTHEDLYRFLQAIEVRCSGDDAFNDDDDSFSDIDDSVISMINDLAKKFSLESCAFEFPSEILMYKLYHVSSLYAGCSEDVNPVFQREIVDFFSHRGLFGFYKNPRKLDDKKKEERNKMLEKIKEFFPAGIQGQGDSDNNLITQQVEGSIYVG